MDDSESVNRFLVFREYKVLDGYGSISLSMTKGKAHDIYDEFNKTKTWIRC